MSGGSSSAAQLKGYKYYLGAQFALCYGPVDKVTEIVFDDDKVAWTGSLTSSGTVNVSAEDLFGGEDREGGVSGPFTFAFGDSTQGTNSYLVSKFGSANIPAFRELLTLIFEHVYIGFNNYYIKSPGITVTRIHKQTITGSAQWQDALAEPSAGQMNAVHIIRECITSSWGLNKDYTKVDEVSFLAAAQTIYNEGFGLSFTWDNSTKVEDFIQEVLEHVNGVLYEHRVTGLYTIKLIRDDYDINTIPVVDKANIIEVSSFKRTLVGELTSSITLTYNDSATRQKGTESLKDLTLIQRQGGIVHKDITRNGIRSAELAATEVANLLSQLSVPTYMISLQCSRAIAENLYEGDVFIFRNSDYIDTDLVFRVTDIDLGDSTKGNIKINAVEDIFKATQAVYPAPPSTGWVDPINNPSAVSDRKLMEIPYYTVARAVGDTVAQGYPTTEAGIIEFAAAPTSDAFSAHLWSQAGGDYVQRGMLYFCPYAVISNSLGLETSSTLTLSSSSNLQNVSIGSYAQIEDEIVSVVSIAGDYSSCVVNRGVLDTVPTTHNSSVKIYFWQKYFGTDAVEWLVGETVYTKLTTITGKGELALASANADNITLSGRMHKPYAPGNVKLNDVAYPTTAVTLPITVSWSHRDRLQQTAGVIVSQTSGNIGPETDVTYNCRLYDDNTLVDEVTDVTGTSAAFSGDGDTYYSLVQLLLHFNGTNGSTTVIDSSAAARTVTCAGNAALSTTWAGYGTASGHISSSASSANYFSIAHAASLNLGSSDFCIEAYIKWGTTATHASYTTFPVCAKRSSANNLSYHFDYYNGSWRFIYSTSGSAWAGTITWPWTPTINTTYYLRLSRIGTSLYLSINGTQVDVVKTLSATLYASTAAMNVMGFSTFNATCDGYMDEFRLTIGNGREAPTYSTQTAEWPSQGELTLTNPRIELEASRNGVLSYQKHNIPFSV